MFTDCVRQRLARHRDVRESPAARDTRRRELQVAIYLDGLRNIITRPPPLHLDWACHSSVEAEIAIVFGSRDIHDRAQRNAIDRCHNVPVLASRRRTQPVFDAQIALHGATAR
jgi:hypothetical protein